MRPIRDRAARPTPAVLVSPPPPEAPDASRLLHVGSWALWGTPGPFIVWLVGVVTATAGLAVVLCGQTEFPAASLLTWLALAACGSVCVEAARRTDQPAGIVKDLLSAWTLPVALLLPPFYALLIAVPFSVHPQLRLGRSLVYRRVYSTAVVGLATAAVSELFHSYCGWAGTDGLRDGRSLTVVVALASAAVGAGINVVLIAVGVRLAAIESRWPDLIGDADQRLIDLAEVCLGVAVAACWGVSAALGLTLLIPVLLVQRSFTHSQLKAAARTDAKTGLLNAAAWQREAEREIVRARRQRQPMAVLLADLDHFKRINDAHGHLVGDRALLGAVQALRDTIREYDLLGRFGGEEFTAVLPGADIEEAVRVAARLRAAVASTRVPLDGVDVQVTVSIGIAVLGIHGSDLTDLLTAADHALYQAKKLGRNQVHLAS